MIAESQLHAGDCISNDPRDPIKSNHCLYTCGGGQVEHVSAASGQVRKLVYLAFSLHKRHSFWSEIQAMSLMQGNQLHFRLTTPNKIILTSGRLSKAAQVPKKSNVRIQVHSGICKEIGPMSLMQNWDVHSYARIGSGSMEATTRPFASPTVCAIPCSNSRGNLPCAFQSLPFIHRQIDHLWFPFVFLN